MSASRQFANAEPPTAPRIYKGKISKYFAAKHVPVSICSSGRLGTLNRRSNEFFSPDAFNERSVDRHLASSLLNELTKSAPTDEKQQLNKMKRKRNSLNLIVKCCALIVISFTRDESRNYGNESERNRNERMCKVRNSIMA